MNNLSQQNKTDILDILSTKKVLYAEDEASVAKNTIEILELFFRKVVHVSDGQAALDEFSFMSYDVLILDICMPNMDGLEAVSRIRKFNHKVPIIILSAFTAQEYLWRAVELKITRYLQKPYNKDSLIDALSNVSLELVDYNVLVKLTNKHSYDSSLKIVHCEDKDSIKLSQSESRLLEYLIQRKNHVVSFEDIYDYVWEFQEPSKEAIKSIIKELRKKIDKSFIKNVYGIGYTLEI